VLATTAATIAWMGTGSSVTRSQTPAHMDAPELEWHRSRGSVPARARPWP
jgi:hypothetical protein